MLGVLYTLLCHQIAGLYTPKVNNMSKEIKIWIGKTLNGDESEFKVRTLKSLCGKVGVSYNTARKRQDMDGGRTVWLVDGKVAWEFWVEKVGK